MTHGIWMASRMLVMAGRGGPQGMCSDRWPCHLRNLFSHHRKARDALLSGQIIIKVTTIQVKPQWVEGHGTSESNDTAVHSRGSRTEMDTSAEMVMLPKALDVTEL